MDRHSGYSGAAAAGPFRRAGSHDGNQGRKTDRLLGDTRLDRRRGLTAAFAGPVVRSLPHRSLAAPPLHHAGGSATGHAHALPALPVGAPANSRRRLAMRRP